MEPSSKPTPGDEDSSPLIRVMVASERDPVMHRVRAGLSDVPDFLVLGPMAIPNGALLGTIKLYRPDVVILDQPVMRRIGGRALSQLVNLPSQPRVLLLCDRPEPRVAGTVLKHRFYGYVGAGAEMGILSKAIRCVFRGELWVPRPALTDALYGPSPARTTANSRRAS